MSYYCLVGAVLLNAVSGVPGAVVGRRGRGAGDGRFGELAAAAMVALGCALGLSAALGTLLGGAGGGFWVRGPLPELVLRYRIDPIGAFFLVPICIVGAAGAIYGLGYWSERAHPRTGRRLRFCYGLLVAGLTLVVLADDAIAFLFGWEVMALSAFFLVGAEEHRREAREAGWVYLVATHVGTLSLFALFALWRAAAGSFEFRPLMAGQAGLGLRTAIFLLALVGFGVKAGMMPLHFWLPSAHANAPSHVSAILSGVVLKVGIYGLVRTVTLLPAPPASWGAAVLLLGVISGVLGVLFALGQHDLKRLLAYHSIENIGIILIGLGLALVGQSLGRPELVVLGLAGGLLHVWNHALFKSLLFYAAGAVIHAVRTREIDRMGGLAKRMPATAAMFLVGAVAICGLPPLNGFVSELLIYVGLFRSLERGAAPAAALAAPALALIGALAVACFVKAFGAVFLGLPRSRPADAAEPHEAPATMTLPMGALAAGCAAIGVLPVLAVRPLSSVIHQWNPSLRQGPVLETLAPIATVTWIAIVLAALTVAAIVLARLAARRRGPVEVGTWDCGYARPTGRMQYTASSFAASLVALFAGVLRPRTHAPEVNAEAFPSSGTARFESHVDDAVLDGLLSPLWRRFRSGLGWLRFLQRGSVQAYVLYILIILALLLLLMLPARQMLRAILGGEPS